MILTVHQPNLFPYEGVFDKIRAADMFVVLGHVQFCRRQYQSRFDFQGKWYTMSVDAGRGLIVDKRYISSDYDWRKIKRSLPGCPLDQFDDCISESLFDTNTRILSRLMELLGIRDTAVVEDCPTNLAGTERIVDICKRFGATVYLSGPSGREYLDAKQFEAVGVELRFFEPKGRRAAVEMLG